MADVFISYATPDRDRVSRLVEHIEAAGFSVWWDRRIDVGVNFDREIEAQLAAAGCVVVVWTPHSLKSDWVYNEAQEGHNRGILIPISLDDTEPPLAFRRVQTATFPDHPATEDFHRITSSIANLVNGGPNQSIPTEPARGYRFSRAAALILALGVLTIALIVGMSALTNREPMGTDEDLDLSVHVNLRSFTETDHTLKTYSQRLSDGIEDSFSSYREISLRKQAEAPSTYVVTPEIQKLGDRLYARVQLDRHGERVWATTVEIVDQTGFEELIKLVSRQMRQEIINDFQCREIHKKTQVLEAADAACLALSENYRINQGGDFHPDSLREHAKLAIDLDPNLADGWWSLAVAELMTVWWNLASWQEAADKANAAIDRALVLEPRNPLFMWLKGVIALNLELDFPLAESMFEQAIAMDHLHPNARWFMADLGELSAVRGNLERATDYYAQSIKAFNADARIYHEYSALLNHAGDHRKAIVAANTGLSIAEEGAFNEALLVQKLEAQLAMGEKQSAKSTLEQIPTRSRHVHLLLALDKAQEAEARLAFLTSRQDARPWEVVLAYVSLGDADEAFTWIDRAIEDRISIGLMGIPLRIDRRLLPLRSDPRWEQLERRLGEVETEARGMDDLAVH